MDKGKQQGMRHACLHIGVFGGKNREDDGKDTRDETQVYLFGARQIPKGYWSSLHSLDP